MSKRTVLAALAAAAALVVPAAASAAAGPFLNAGFETGGFFGWNSNVASFDGGDWYISSGGSLPLSGLPGLAPAAGSFDAVFDESSPSYGILYQPFDVPASGTVTISYAYRNTVGWAMDEGDPYNLDSEEAENQWVSIDVLTEGADATSLDPGDVITTVFRSSDSSPLTAGWTTVTVDLSAYIGQTVQLRYAIVNDLGYLNLFADAPSAGGSKRGGAAIPPEVTHVGYCTVPGNTWADGSAIPVGTFVNLEIGQPDRDTHYKGAQPANFVQGTGITCDQVPLGFTQQGFADESMGVPGGIYPYYAPPLPTSAFRVRGYR